MPSNHRNSVILMSQGKIEDLMVTAVINILDNENQPVRCRTLLDTAATSNLITENLANALRLTKNQYSITIGGLGDIQTSTSHMITATIQSRYNKFEKNLQFFTVSEITKKHPENTIDRDKIGIPSHIDLADTTFHIPSGIDMLIGAGPSLSMLLPGHLNLSPSQGPDLHLQNTTLGWIIGGAIPVPSNLRQRNRTIKCHLTTTQAVNQLCKTWEIEEGANTKHLSKEEIQCENHYKTTHQRNDEGKYVVALPFNSKKSALGESKSRALNRLRSLETKFAKNPDFKTQYVSVIQEYFDLGHIEAADDNSSENFYLPHHAVIKESSLTTKVRVVFDGSAKSSSGISLNETLMVGPTIQNDIVTHLLRFRLHTIVLSGDIEKMYRQIWVRPEDRKFQRILWRDNDGIIRDYQLKTVTFGLAPAPFLAIRSLYQLAEDEEENFPIASKIIKRDMYVDDLLTGAQTLEEALTVRDEIIQLLQRGNLNIRQWASNNPKLLEGLPKDNINSKIHMESDPILKTLGIHWQSQTDSIIYTLNELPSNTTMREILAETAKIFDPIGLLGPLVISARLILQDCWRQQLTWDQPLPTIISQAWSEYITEFNRVKEISFGRAVIPPNTIHIQLHGFADASEKAYGACIYLRCTTQSNNTSVKLLCAKTKVAPLKTITLARLELCAATMLAQLYHSIKEYIYVQIQETMFWIDSTIAIHWINTPPYLLKTFVANRVSDIQSKTKTATWRHIRSENNPADALSRGQSPQNFINNILWRDGPFWLKHPDSEWPKSIIQTPIDDEEKRKYCCFATCVKSSELDDGFITKFSNVNTLHRSIAYCLRFSSHNKFRGNLTVKELLGAQYRIVKLIQLSRFAKEIHQLNHGQNVEENSKLKQLSPFIDKQGILRVGGRLQHSDVSYDQQHPILLPASHTYTTLVIKDTHERNFHSGTQATLYSIRRKFWPLNGRNETKRVIHRCVRCIRAKPRTATYPMGDLPRERVTQVRPFYHTGIDYCGPFWIKEKHHRNRGKLKIYVAVFVCLTVKAVHLELVSDLTSEAFIATLRRFIARRGKCHTIHSDNAKNFVGANNQLKELYQSMNSEAYQQNIARHLMDEGIEWKFIPAHSPNFGGLWEAAVKSYKHHMTRIIGDTLLTFEQFNTYVIEIEAILNSRPITTLSSDPNDPIAITPGHFIIGDSLTCVPDWDWENTPSNKVSCWQQIQKFKQLFWKRWHKDYLNGLNIRNKWTKGQHNIKEGTIVVIKEDNVKPMRWPIGRIIQTHPGTDSIVRAVSIKTATGIIQRNVRDLSILLPEEKEK